MQASKGAGDAPGRGREAPTLRAPQRSSWCLASWWCSQTRRGGSACSPCSHQQMVLYVRGLDIDQVCGRLCSEKSAQQHQVAGCAATQAQDKGTWAQWSALTAIVDEPQTNTARFHHKQRINLDATQMEHLSSGAPLGEGHHLDADEIPTDTKANQKPCGQKRLRTAR